MNKITAYVRETRGEFSKITWPARNEAVRLTLMVVLFTAIFAVFLGAVDYAFGEVVKTILFAS